MKSLRIIFFLSAFLAMGESLECPVCNATSMSNCIESNHTCLPGFDHCGIILLRKTWRPKEQIVLKSCVRAKDCKDRLAILNMGDGRTILGKCSSCVGKDCKGTPIIWPPKRNPYNRKTCEACYSGDKECNAKATRCREGEEYCSMLSGSTEGNPRRSTMRGCVNQAFCDSRKMLTPLLGFTTLHSDHCWLAMENALAAKNIPELLGVFLLSLLGLILTQGLP